MIKIAFQMKNEDNMIPTTFFYRYDKNGQLDYLGMAESGVINCKRLLNQNKYKIATA